MIPFFSTTFYGGPVAQALGGADMSFIVGLAVSAVLYYIFSSNLDLTAEAEARCLRRLQLEGSAD